MNDLNMPMFSPRSAKIDRKRIMEYLEHKYREFITATLRCLSDLKRELCRYFASHRVEFRPCVVLQIPLGMS